MQNTLTELKTRIRYKIPYLTEPQKEIANYIIENMQKVGLSSIRELEAELKASKSTIVRLAQLLGFGGFQELKAAILKSMRRELDPTNRYQSFLAKRFDNSTHLKLIADEAVTNIHETLLLVDPEQYWKAVHLLKNATTVYTMGLGISTYLAQIAAYLLNRIGLSAHAMAYAGFTFEQQIVNMKATDVIVAFSFPPFSKETIQGAAAAQRNGIKVIALTNKLTNKIVQYSEIFLPISIESTTISNSMSMVLIMLNSILTDLALKMKRKTLQAIESDEMQQNGQTA